MMKYLRKFILEASKFINIGITKIIALKVFSNHSNFPNFITEIGHLISINLCAKIKFQIDIGISNKKQLFKIAFIISSSLNYYSLLFIITGSHRPFFIAFTKS